MAVAEVPLTFYWRADPWHHHPQNVFLVFSTFRKSLFGFCVKLTCLRKECLCPILYGEIREGSPLYQLRRNMFSWLSYLSWFSSFFLVSLLARCGQGSTLPLPADQANRETRKKQGNQEQPGKTTKQLKNHENRFSEEGVFISL